MITRFIPILCPYQAVVFVALLGSSASEGFAQALAAGAELTFDVAADSTSLLCVYCAPPDQNPQYSQITVSGASQLGYRYIGGVTSDGQPNFAVVSPSTGIAPGTILVSLNPSIVSSLPSMIYKVTLQFAAPGQTSGPYATIGVTLNVIPAGQPQIKSVLNAATLQPNISPGALVSIFGSHLGTGPVTATYNDAGAYPTDLSHQNVPYPSYYNGPHDGVTFNSIPAPLLYSSPGQINAIVPYELAGQSSVDVVVAHNGFASSPFTVPLSATSPGIFTAGQNGTGQAATVGGPAAVEGRLTIFATGFGPWNYFVPDGTVLFGGGPGNCNSSLISTGCTNGFVVPPWLPATPVSLTIGGQPAPLQYVGPSPGTVAGLLQINALVPAGIGPGPQPIVLTVGQNNNAQQQVTVAVQ
jgi:uncharacterized protein (TIGR03437 family)